MPAILINPQKVWGFFSSLPPQREGQHFFLFSDGADQPAKVLSRTKKGSGPQRGTLNKLFKDATQEERPRTP